MRFGRCAGDRHEVSGVVYRQVTLPCTGKTIRETSETASLSSVLREILVVFDTPLLALKASLLSSSDPLSLFSEFTINHVESVA